MSEYDTAYDYAQWLEHVADDAYQMANACENTNNRHPMAAWLLGAEFALRYAAYEARELE